MSNFSFFHNVFKSFLVLIHQNEYLWSKGLKQLQESMERRTGCCNITEILLKTALTHYQMTNFRLCKLKEFADDNFKFYKNGRKLSKQLENTVGKGEIARYEQFLLFPQSFQKACFPGVSKGVIVWEWVKHHTINRAILKMILESEQMLVTRTVCNFPLFF